MCGGSLHLLLSETDGQRLERLATKFIGHIAEIIFKVH
jgi:hypothetical protein